MTVRAKKFPSPDHPIAIEPKIAQVVVKVAGKVIADTQRALALREADYPQALYIPRQDVDMSALERTDQSTYCPYKGDCGYYSIPSGRPKATNAAWTYEAPYDAVAAIKGHLCFYSDRVDAIEIIPLSNVRTTS